MSVAVVVNYDDDDDDDDDSSDDDDYDDDDVTEVHFVATTIIIIIILIIILTVTFSHTLMHPGLSPCWSLQYHPSSVSILSGHSNGELCVWSEKYGVRTQSLPLHSQCVSCIAANSDVVVTGSRDNTVRIVDFVTGRQLKVGDG